MYINSKTVIIILAISLYIKGSHPTFAQILFYAALTIWASLAVVQGWLQYRKSKNKAEL